VPSRAAGPTAATRRGSAQPEAPNPAPPQLLEPLLKRGRAIAQSGRCCTARATAVATSQWHLQLQPRPTQTELLTDKTSQSAAAAAHEYLLQRQGHFAHQVIRHTTRATGSLQLQQCAPDWPTQCNIGCHNHQPTTGDTAALHPEPAPSMWARLYSSWAGQLMAAFTPAGHLGLPWTTTHPQCADQHWHQPHDMNVYCNRCGNIHHHLQHHLLLPAGQSCM
jgi:hypothetical protein